MNPMMSLFFFLGCSGRSSSRSSTPRSSPQPRASPAATYVSSSPAPSPAPTRSSSPRTERSTPPTYRTSSDDDYNLFGGIFRGMRSDDQDSSNDGDGGTSHGESLFGDTLYCAHHPLWSLSLWQVLLVHVTLNPKLSKIASTILIQTSTGPAHG
ncbi:uncharacterized protein LOC9307447 isoform X2 [Arabidopsis lyrata subsp. lyrata]|uniref:uncharacterized protein LOC9307447 isoform X2 n=1 Tax=Arabidopsis lyrata subsp. lyrata TaxID=81972 RepID=UPI000A29AD7C|nr:uncharacterized protein LOC9307447 isoform X2 [Arabidopsis lyrata subsp. lyrata]|eukprot:XP_020879186.1 uncharacterized protein LOC9307447 isoform X2 [Arabidopsis lyrata subsp. lyrata]